MLNKKNNEFAEGQGKETNKTNVHGQLLSGLLENYDGDKFFAGKNLPNENKRKVPNGTYAQLSGLPLEGPERKNSEQKKPSMPTSKKYESKRKMEVPSSPIKYHGNTKQSTPNPAEEVFSMFKTQIDTRFKQLDPKTRSKIFTVTDEDYLNSLSKQSMRSMPLHSACRSGDIAEVKRLLESKKVKINSKNNTAQTPLFIAVAEFNLAIIQLLISLGANKDVDCNNVTALQYAIEHSTKREHVEVVRFLIESGANLKGDKLLHSILNKSRSNIHDKEIFTLLVKHGALLVKISDMERAAEKAGNNFIVKLIREEGEMLQGLQASFLQRQEQQSAADKGLPLSFLRRQAQQSAAADKGFERFLQVQPQQEALVNQLKSSLNIQSSVILMLVMAYCTNVPFNWVACGASFAYFGPKDLKKEKPTYRFMPTVEQIKEQFYDAVSPEMWGKIHSLESYEHILDFISDKTNRAEFLKTPVMEFLKELESRLNERTLPTISLLPSP